MTTTALARAFAEALEDDWLTYDNKSWPGDGDFCPPTSSDSTTPSAVATSGSWLCFDHGIHLDGSAQSALWWLRILLCYCCEEGSQVLTGALPTRPPQGVLR